MITISIVSHGQGGMLDQLLADLGCVASTSAIEIIITENIADDYHLTNVPTACPVHFIRNAEPKGFGANHNQAFAKASGDLFCILNPDIRIHDDPFPVLSNQLALANAGAIAPAIVAPNGLVEDSARHFPTPWSLARRMTGGPDGRYHFVLGEPPQFVDWVAGMFILFDMMVFREIGGFDTRFFMYCEDIDISARIWRARRSVQVCPLVTAVHDAQRASRRNFEHLRWEVTSYLRYFIHHPFFALPKTLDSDSTLF
jgi:N-acetylglucosaminyl-diphospho-decaprenol L-rhamnosyltransferase